MSEKGKETTIVRIADLLRYERFQVRRKLDPATVQRYASVYQSGNSMPAIRAARINGALVVVDGWHRLAALESIGVCDVETEIIEATASEALWLAAKANLQHGLPLKSAEILRAFKAFIRARRHVDERGRYKSYRQIASELGGAKSHNTIHNWMKNYFPKIAERMTDESRSKDTGGHHDKDPEAGFEKVASDSISKAIAAARGITDPSRRGRLIEQLGAALRELREGQPWEPADF